MLDSSILLANIGLERKSPNRKRRVDVKDLINKFIYFMLTILKKKAKVTQAKLIKYGESSYMLSIFINT